MKMFSSVNSILFNCLSATKRNIQRQFSSRSASIEEVDVSDLKFKPLDHYFAYTLHFNADLFSTSRLAEMFHSL